jgi:hypothetical protein
LKKVLDRWGNHQFKLLIKNPSNPSPVCAKFSMHPHLELASTPQVTSDLGLSANDDSKLTSGQYQASSTDRDHEKGSIAPTPADPVGSDNHDRFLSRLIWAGFVFPSLITLVVNDAM